MKEYYFPFEEKDFEILENVISLFGDKAVVGDVEHGSHCGEINLFVWDDDIPEKIRKIVNIVNS